VQGEGVNNRADKQQPNNPTTQQPNNTHPMSKKHPTHPIVTDKAEVIHLQERVRQEWH
jgi:hypothetical protein